MADEKIDKKAQIWRAMESLADMLIEEILKDPTIILSQYENSQEGRNYLERITDNCDSRLDLDEIAVYCKDFMDKYVILEKAAQSVKEGGSDYKIYEVAIAIAKMRSLRDLIKIAVGEEI